MHLVICHVNSQVENIYKKSRASYDLRSGLSSLDWCCFSKEKDKQRYMLLAKERIEYDGEEPMSLTKRAPHSTGAMTDPCGTLALIGDSLERHNQRKSN